VGVTISAIIASHGDPYWERLGRMRAFASTSGQDFDEVVVMYNRDMTLAEARNAGAREASGEYLLFIDADDEIAPGFADAMRESISRLDPGKYLLTPAIRYGAGRVFSTPRFWPEIDIRTGNWMVVGTLVPRSLFELAGGWDEYELYEDWAIWAKCMELGATPIKVPDAHYMVHVSANSRNRGNSQKTYRYWRQKIGSDIWPDLYLSPTEEEDESHELETPVRFYEGSS
jgi:glycosyltransferase involved in cell wall biosynthesis